MSHTFENQHCGLLGVYKVTLLINDTIKSSGIYNIPKLYFQQIF